MRAGLLALMVSLTCISSSFAQSPSAWSGSGLPAGPQSNGQPPAGAGTGQQSPPLAPGISSVIPNYSDLHGSDEKSSTCDQGCCSACGPPGQFWIGADYLMWWTSGSHLPALITAAPVNSTNFGELGKPDTTVLYGNKTVNNQMESGVQFYGGFWFNDCHTCGLEFSFFDLFTSRSSYNATPNGNYTLYRPFFNTSTNSQGAEFATSVHASNEMSLLGGDINMRKQLCCADTCNGGYRVDLLVGYRVLSLQENLEVDEFVNSTNPPGTILVQDKFTTNNVFNGGQIGLDAEFAKNSWIFGIRSLVALGVTTETVNISGLTVINSPLSPQIVLPGGLLAQKTNMGYYTRNAFAVVPDVGVRFGRQITENIRFTVGYDFLYWSNVLHAANQVDTAVNPYYVPTTGQAVGSPTPARPEFVYHSSGLVVSGVTFALEFRY